MLCRPVIWSVFWESRSKINEILKKFTYLLNFLNNIFGEFLPPFYLCARLR
uniref:Uncharacterized protein n=1 Tax=Siphoviridae sp. ctBLh2 TaxID=2827803 RepID=A0A8S5S4I5_9CAUD|nr:MAG TPA: hypothetical protein [Siphoviridae sp. ctBLh2]